MKKLYLDYAEFYITNVCNLTCSGCNRFNDKKFKGWQSWADHADTYNQWSQQLDLGSIAIMGGEPLLNPTFYDWVHGLSAAWPNKDIIVSSNGTQLDRHHQLYDIMKDNPRIIYDVSLHNKIEKHNIIDKIKNFLQEPFTYKFDETAYREVLTITDVNNVSVVVRYNWWFHQGAVRTDSDTGRYTLHNSDPEKAHDICHSKTCHHFDHGRLYKCGPGALFKSFDQQFNLLLSPEDRTLINHIPHLSIEDSYDTKQQFLQSIKKSIPQCKFCPEFYVGDQIFSIEKKDL